MLELLTALVVLGVALSGLFPLLVQYSRQVQQLERCSPQTGRCQQAADHTWTYQAVDPAQATSQHYPSQWYLAPSTDPWMWKLGAAASLQQGSPTFPPNILPSYSQNSFAIAYIPINPSSPLVAYPGDSSSYTNCDPSLWLNGPPGYNGASRQHLSAAASTDTATWTFANVQPGWYVVEATWPDPVAFRPPRLRPPMPRIRFVLAPTPLRLPL